jgi:large subunit ribosomal protein L2
MLKRTKPTTSSRRHRLEVDKSILFQGEPEKSLLMPGHKKRQGRGFKGHVTVRHRGGGVKKKMRIIDWKRDKFGVPGRVDRIEYDPMRGANLALIVYADGDKRYMIAPDALKINDTVMSGEKAEIRVGNALPLKLIPVGTPIHNLELRKGRGAQMARGAGTAAYIQSKEENMITVQMPSREIRLIPAECLATIGQVGNSDWKNRKLGKAGRKRLMGIRPTVRGTAMQPNSHPHGGGEGRSGVGLKYPKTPWGKHALGTKTRKKSKYTNKYIIKDRRTK